MIKIIIDWCVRLRFPFRIDDGDSTHVEELYRLFPNVDTPRTLRIVEKKYGFVDQFVVFGATLRHRGKMYGDAISVASEDTLMRKAFVARFIREVYYQDLTPREVNT